MRHAEKTSGIAGVHNQHEEEQRNHPHCQGTDKAADKDKAWVLQIGSFLAQIHPKTLFEIWLNA